MIVNKGKIYVIAALCCMLYGFTMVTSKRSLKTRDLQEQLIGEWRNRYLRVEMPTVSNTDKRMVLEADSSHWEATLKIKPIRTFFSTDGNYRSEYRNLKDSVAKISLGTWAVSGDSLLMMQLKPEKTGYRFRLIIDKDIATFKGLIDFDEDGKADDLYYGVQRKYSE